MGNVQGYVKVNDNQNSSRHLIRVSKLHSKIKNEVWLYDFQNNEFGRIINDTFVPYLEVNVSGLGVCYQFDVEGQIEIYNKTWLLDFLKDAAVTHINDAIASGKPSDDKDLIDLK